MDLTYHTEETMCTLENSLVLVDHNIRGIVSKIEELQEYFSTYKNLSSYAMFF